MYRVTRACVVDLWAGLIWPFPGIPDVVWPNSHKLQTVSGSHHSWGHWGLGTIDPGDKWGDTKPQTAQDQNLHSVLAPLLQNGPSMGFACRYLLCQLVLGTRIALRSIAKPCVTTSLGEGLAVTNSLGHCPAPAGCPVRPYSLSASMSVSSSLPMPFHHSFVCSVKLFPFPISPEIGLYRSVG